MIYLELFLAFLQIGAFSFGGGYAAMPLIRQQVIIQHAWITETDFANLVTIAEMTPGPIAINGATFVGNQVAGIPGAVAATIGCALPSCIFVTILAILYQKYREMPMLQGVLKNLRPTVVSMILAAGLGILIPTVFASGTVSFVAGNVQWRFVIYFLGCLFALRRWKPNPILVMVVPGVAELLFRLAGRVF
ncbi:MAG: chromate transporter [Lachnospiraceae bacterium]|nr:chromate transporter [Lachnospiraceae bacterium]MBQ9563232.1 chromate transporter [Lachnospiraceae bacterium]MBR0153706.1 chromate transporter [Lachnospiraceae bacterium]